MVKTMRKRVMLLVAVGVLAALAIAGTVLAQTPPGQGPNPSPAPGPQSGQDQGVWGACHGNGGYGNVMWQSVAKALGLSTDELNVKLEGGQSIRDLAKAKGLSDADLVTAFRDAAKSMMAQLVENGQLTQQQADYMLNNMQSHMTDETWLSMIDAMSGNGWGHMGGMMGGNWGGPGGMMGGWNNGAPRGSSSNGGMMGGGWGGRGGMMGGRFF
ncbi:MAG: hypothetical protein EPO21_01110 [Chloroflexota bacterium]|nr:MAG: hypothetical protein EPO21_01110 [Chloroflexota bacterium]